MASCVFFLLFTTIASMQIQMSPRDILNEIQKKQVKNFDDPEPGEYRKGQHGEATQIHGLLDTIDRRIIDAMKFTKDGNVTSTNKIIEDRDNEIERLGRNTEIANEAHIAAKNKTGVALEEKENAGKAYDDAVREQGEAEADLEFRKNDEDSKSSALKRAQESERSGKINANNRFERDSKDLYNTTTKSYNDLCEEILLVAEIRALVSKVNTEYVHDYENPHLGNCRMCTKPDYGDCTTADLNLDDEGESPNDLPTPTGPGYPIKPTGPPYPDPSRPPGSEIEEEECLGSDC